MKTRQFLRKLRAQGATVDVGRGKGGHVYVRYRGRKSIVKMHGSKDLDNRYIRLVCSQLGIDPGDLQE
ncbi:MAG: type II toxin-antitoxin system HicA family toxin [Thiotrichales bacterium]|nr:type II toxin-antitoxin system HicA family toxin [Thiotrichales bacterium]MCY4285551.1 type II toxin-antitoxin system HicA family toxin [Thiotrichales bacterium]